jgi:hypothetical protein
MDDNALIGKQSISSWGYLGDGSPSGDTGRSREAT